MNQTEEKSSFFNGEGQVRALLRGYDWSASPLGEPQSWPQELMTVLNLVLDSKFPMFVAWGPELGFLYNDAYSFILGTKHPAALGSRFQDVWAEIWDDITPIIGSALAGKSAYFEDLPLTISRKGYNEQVWFTFSYSPVRNAEGAVVGMYCTVVETTSRMHLEQRQAFRIAMADRLRALTEPEQIVATASKMLGRQLQADRVLYSEVDDAGGTFVTGHGWSRSAAQALADNTGTLADFGPDMLAELGAAKVIAIPDVTLDSRTASPAHRYSRLVGSQALLCIPVVKSGRLSGLLTVHHAQPYHWSAAETRMAQDMADRTWSAVEAARAQHELRTERDLSNYIFDSMAEGFALLDRDWRLVQVNEMAAQITRRPRAELLGANQWQAVPELVGTEVEALYRRVRARRRAETIEHFHTYPSGQTGWIEIRAYPLPGSRLAIFFRDVTARKETEQELREASARKDEFLAMLAHELRNPLAPIGSAAELLQMVTLDPARVRQTSEIISRQVKHMTHLVDDLLDVSRVTRGLVKLDRSRLDVADIVADAVEQVTPLIQARRHELQLEVAPERALVTGDRKRLVQVVSNLLNNAAKYTPEGGHIRLRTEIEDGQILLEVADDGIGMQAELAGRVFDLFAQAERTSDRSSGGLGLGLALVKRLTELHGGSVQCSSAGLGLGSRFSIRLPRVVDQRQSPRGDQPAAGAAQPSASLLILLVDDNVDAADMLTLLLEQMGHRVLVEHDSVRALERARRERPDVCLLDIGLPGMDGNQLAQHLRAMPETAGALLVAITGYGQEQDRKDSYAAGFDRHLVKPVDTRELATLLAGVRRP